MLRVLAGYFLFSLLLLSKVSFSESRKDKLDFVRNSAKSSSLQSNGTGKREKKCEFKIYLITRELKKELFFSAIGLPVSQFSGEFGTT